ncbi:MAG: hypothetical protein FWD28_11275 [Treponema sp.]|nr:hypothetical protein [Treponema sp.]
MDDIIVEFHEAAFRHNISKEDIIHALNHRIHAALIEELPDKWAVIGPNRAGNPLELIYVEVDDNSICVYHAMTARDSFIEKYGL